MLAAGAFRCHWMFKVGEELADLWVLKLEQWYICRQEGLNQLAYIFLFEIGVKVCCRFSAVFTVVESSFLCFADDWWLSTLKHFSQLTVWQQRMQNRSPSGSHGIRSKILSHTAVTCCLQVLELLASWVCTPLGKNICILFYFQAFCKFLGL